MAANVEQLHSIWLDGMVNFSFRYLARKHGIGMCEAAVVTAIQESNNSYRVVGKFRLPYGSDKLIMHMARFSRCTLFEPDEIVNLEANEFPETTFCLQSLLQASFPKNVMTGVFKAHDGALDAGMEDEDTGFRFPHVAFSGVGIIVMNECRKIFFPLAPDSEVIRMADRHFLCVMGEKRLLERQ